MLAFFIILLSHERQFYVVIFFLANSEAFEARSEVSSELVPSFNSVVDKLRTLDQLHAAAMPWHIGLAYSACAIRTCNYSRLFQHNSRMPKYAKIIPGIISAGLVCTQSCHSVPFPSPRVLVSLSLSPVHGSVVAEQVRGVRWGHDKRSGVHEAGGRV